MDSRCINFHRFVLTLHPGDLPAGAHSGYVLLWSPAHPNASGTPFTIMNRGTSFPKLVETTAPKGQGSVSEARRQGAEKNLISDSNHGLVPGKDLPLEVVLAGPTDSCPDLPGNVALIALLDGAQIDLGELGSVAATRLKQGESATFSFILRNLPQDAKSHFLQLWSLPSYLEPTEVPAYELAPWYGFASTPGFLIWGSKK